MAEDIVDRVDTSPIQLVNLVTTETDAKRYRRNGLWTSDTLSGRVADLARGDRRKDAAVIDLLGQRTRSYADLALDAAKVAAALTAGGVCALRRIEP